MALWLTARLVFCRRFRRRDRTASGPDDLRMIAARQTGFGVERCQRDCTGMTVAAQVRRRKAHAIHVTDGTPRPGFLARLPQRLRSEP
jgi:hypothetical protein